MFEEQQQQSRDGLHDDFLVTIDVNAQLHALKDCDTEGEILVHFMFALQLFKDVLFRKKKTLHKVPL